MGRSEQPRHGRLIAPAVGVALLTGCSGAVPSSPSTSAAAGPAFLAVGFSQVARKPVPASPRTVVTKAIKDLGKHGPFRLASTGIDPKEPDQCLVVAPNRYHEWVHGPDGSVSQFIRIGSRQWMKLGTDPWESADDLGVAGIACAVPTLFLVRSGTEKSKRGASVRQIAGMATVLGKAMPYTARVDRAGRLLTFVIGSGTARSSYQVTYDRSITVVPPV